MFVAKYIGILYVHAWIVSTHWVEETDNVLRKYRVFPWTN